MTTFRIPVMSVALVVCGCSSEGGNPDAAQDVAGDQPSQDVLGEPGGETGAETGDKGPPDPSCGSAMDGSGSPPTMAGTWASRSLCRWPRAYPIPATNALLVYNSGRGTMTMIAGEPPPPADGAFYTDVWEWHPDSATWERLSSCLDAGPHLRTAVYDEAGGRVIAAGDGALWRWDCATRTWIDVTPAGIDTKALESPPLAYSRKLSSIFVLGTRLMWEWNMVTGAVVKHEAKSGVLWPLPTVSMDIDTKRDVLVAMGVRPDQSRFEVWEWRFAEAEWTHRTPDPRPASWPQLSGPGIKRIAFDEPSGEFLSFVERGYSDIGPALWTWDPVTNLWEEVGRLGGAPWPDEYERRAGWSYDPVRRKIVLYGGKKAGLIPLAETWECDITTRAWENLTPPSVPRAAPVEYQFSVARDDKRGVTYLYRSGDSDVEDGEFWEWNAEKISWRNLTSPPTPLGRFKVGQIIYDRVRDRVIHFGDASGTHVIHEWNPDEGSWIDRTPSWPSSPLSDLVFDTNRGRVIAFTFGFAFEWDTEGDTWSKRVTTGDEIVDGWHVFDEKRDVVVAFQLEGAAALSEWSTATGIWTNRKGSATWPAPRSGASFTYEPTRGQVILFGGFSGGKRLRDIWVWDGTAGTFTDRSPFPLPAAWPSERRHATMTTVPGRSNLMVFGGEGFDSKPILDLWEWKPD